MSGIIPDGYHEYYPFGRYISRKQRQVGVEDFSELRYTYEGKLSLKLDTEMGTPFFMVYDRFFSKITDDMYLELTRADTEDMLFDLLMSAIPKFEFPRFDITDWGKMLDDNDKFYTWGFAWALEPEEINVLATYMVVEWIGQQLASVENTRLKYSGSDFKFTSQANHMQKLLQMKKDYEREGFHLQRLYKRRYRGADGLYRSTMQMIMSPSKVVLPGTSGVDPSVEPDEVLHGYVWEPLTEDWAGYYEG